MLYKDWLKSSKLLYLTSVESEQRISRRLVFQLPGYANSLLYRTCPNNHFPKSTYHRTWQLLRTKPRTRAVVIRNLKKLHVPHNNIKSTDTIVVLYNPFYLCYNCLYKRHHI